MKMKRLVSKWDSDEDVDDHHHHHLHLHHHRDHVSLDDDISTRNEVASLQNDNQTTSSHRPKKPRPNLADHQPSHSIRKAASASSTSSLTSPSSSSSSRVSSTSTLHPSGLSSTTPTSFTAPMLSRPFEGPTIQACRLVDNYEKLNRIDEGSYGIVYRARDRETGEIVALKRLKLENEKNGFPVTTLREIHTLLLSKHPNIVNVKEIVVTPSGNGVFIVMEFVEHDLKALMETMREPFLQSEIKTLMLQLLSAIDCLHRNWIIHRDLKTSNLLMNNRGQIKVADFGLARRVGDPPGPITQLVVTLWYRAPELLLGAKQYSSAIDMWSIGCIFAELVNKEPLLPGRGELDQLNKIFKLLGTPNEKIWPGFSNLPSAKTVTFVNQPYQSLRGRFPRLTELGIDLLQRLLTYDPSKRITAAESLKHPYFSESPLPLDPALFPTFPSKSAGEHRRKIASPSAPLVAHGADGLAEDDSAPSFNFQSMQSTSFRLRF